MTDISDKIKNRFQGQIGIVTLAIGMVPMVLMMILAGYWLQDSQLDAGLNAKLNSNQKGFQAQIMLNQILDTNGTRSDIRQLPYADSRSDKLDEIEGVVESYLEGNYPNQAVEEYDFHINYPESDDVEIKTEEVWLGSDHARADVASPEGQAVYVTLNIDGEVAQAYSPGGNSYNPSYGRVP